MSLSDVIGHLDLATFPMVALPIFIGVFVLVTVRVLRRPKAEMDAAAMIPLREGVVSEFVAAGRQGDSA